MPTENTDCAVPDQRGNFLFKGDDARIFIALVAALTIEQHKPMTAAEVMRQGMLCLAQKKGII